jgi:hypothetical protein
MCSEDRALGGEMSPYKSAAQRKFFHSPGAKKAGITKKEVAEWDKSSKGQKVPKKVKHR